MHQTEFKYNLKYDLIFFIFHTQFESQNSLISHMFCVSGMKAHAEILRLVATLLVLQLIRVKKLEVGRLLESLLRLKESQEPRYQHTSSCGVVIDQFLDPWLSALLHSDRCTGRQWRGPWTGPAGQTDSIHVCAADWRLAGIGNHLHVNYWAVILHTHIPHSNLFWRDVRGEPVM